MQKIVGMTSAQGTLCLETLLTAKEDTTEKRAQIEAEFCTGKPDAPVRGTWLDASGNEEAQRCFVDDVD